MKKKWLFASLAAMMCVTGCSSGSTAATAAASTAAASTAAAASASASATADLSSVSDDTLVVYTNSGDDGRGDWMVEQAKAAGFNVVYMHLPAGELTNRIVAEKNNQIADVVWGLNAVEYEKLKIQDMLVQYTPSWKDEVDQAGYGDPEGYYWPIVVQPLLLAYNPEYLKEADAPKDWTELASKYAGKYTIYPLTGGTAKTIFSSILVRYQDPKGDLGISDEGWQVISDYFKNAYVLGTNEDPWSAMTDGSRPICMIWGSGFLLNEKDLGKTFAFAQPSVGEPVVVEQLAIFKNSKKQELAKKFIDWMGSADVQAAFSAKFGTTPANKKALESSSDDVKNLMAKVTPQIIDWKFVAENLDSWVEKASLNYVQ